MHKSARMRRCLGNVKCFLAFLLSFAAVVGVSSADAPWTQVVAQQCFTCHGSSKQKAGLNLETLLANGQPKAEDRKIWDTVLDWVSDREMPPEDEPQPTEAERQSVIDAISAQLEVFDTTGPTNPGRVTIRRLNRVEYENTIRDLMGVTFKATEAFPRDDVGYGFDNIGDVLSLSPILMEKYLDAAEEIVNKAVLSELPSWPPVTRFEDHVIKHIPKDRDVIRTFQGRYLGFYREGRGEITFEPVTPGTYQLNIRTFQERSGDEPANLRVTLDDALVKDIGIESVRKDPEIVSLTLKLDQPKHRIAVAFTNNQKGGRDRNLFVDYLELSGPEGVPAPPLPETHRRVLPQEPVVGQEEQTMRAALQNFATRAYRRPAKEEEVNGLTKLSMGALGQGLNFHDSLKVGMQAVLVSSQFLFRGEIDPTKPTSDIRDLNAYELASRMSYFLWSSLPDETLLELAESGALVNDEVLVEQAQRMLKDPKAHTLIENFVGQWLQTRNLKTIKPDPQLFPEFDDELRAAMQEETELFFRTIALEDRSLLELLDADYSFVNERLAQHYGLESIKGSGFQRVNFKPEDRRGGILSHAGILTLTSNPDRTSPVVRGKWVLEQLLGTPPPPPPPDVEELEEGAEASESASLRERLEAHRSKPGCAGCHSKMDPIGFALENYDAIGRWRDLDGRFPIDASGELSSGEKITGPEDLRRALSKDEDFLESLCEKMLTYALGRGTEYYDKRTVNSLVDDLEMKQYRFSALITSIVLSDPFRKRQLQTDL